MRLEPFIDGGDLPPPELSASSIVAVDSVSMKIFSGDEKRIFSIAQLPDFQAPLEKNSLLKCCIAGFPPTGRNWGFQQLRMNFGEILISQSGKGIKCIQRNLGRLARAQMDLNLVLGSVIDYLLPVALSRWPSRSIPSGRSWWLRTGISRTVALILFIAGLTLSHLDFALRVSWLYSEKSASSAKIRFISSPTHQSMPWSNIKVVNGRIFVGESI